MQFQVMQVKRSAAQLLGQCGAWVLLNHRWPADLVVEVCGLTQEGPDVKGPNANVRYKSVTLRTSRHNPIQEPEGHLPH
jgi:hypothetical protein